MKAVIKEGYDTRKQQASGALVKWEDIIGLKAGTILKVIYICKINHVTTVELLHETIDTKGNVTRKGARRVVPTLALKKHVEADTHHKPLTGQQPENFDQLMHNWSPWRAHKTEKLIA
jgi:hypothetical protein